MRKKRLKPIEENQSVLNTDLFDRRRFSEILSKSENMQKMLNQGRENLPSFHPFMSDLWASFYKTKPEVKEQVDPSVGQNKVLIEKILEMDEFKKYHPMTRLDDVASSIGTLSYSEKILEWIVEEKFRNEKLSEAINRAINNEKSLNYIQSQLQKNIENTQEDLSEKHKQKLINSKKELEKQHNQTMNEIQQELLKAMNNGQLTKKLVRALEETKEIKKSLDDLLRFGAGSQESDLKTIPLNEKLQLAEMLRKNDKVKRISEWAGRFKEIAKQKRKTKSTNSIERSGVTLGKCVERLLAQELAFYKNVATKYDFLRRFSEGQTMIYEPVGKEEMGKGPFVICLDQSGSMMNLDEQSKGFVLAMAMIARKERRDFAVIPFASNVNLETYFFKKGKIAANELMHMATSFLSGGTLYIPPLRAAMDVIKNNKHLKGVDILFVTDGVPYDQEELYRFIQDQFHTFKKKHEVQVMSVLIGDQCKKDMVELFSDRIIQANDFMNDSVTDLFNM